MYYNIIHQHIPSHTSILVIRLLTCNNSLSHSFSLFRALYCDVIRYAAFTPTPHTGTRASECKQLVKPTCRAISPPVVIPHPPSSSSSTSSCLNVHVGREGVLCDIGCSNRYNNLIKLA